MITNISKVNLNELQESKLVRHNDTDFSVRFKYKGQPLIMETDYLCMVMGILIYRNPHDNLKQYSMSIAIPGEKNIDGSYKDTFARKIYLIDDAVKNFRSKYIDPDILKGYQFESPIRKGKYNLDNHLRVKIYSPNEEELKFDYYLENYDKVSATSMPYKEAKKVIRHGVRARFQLEFRNIWFSTKKDGSKVYGYSYSLNGLQIHNVGFSPEKNLSSQAPKDDWKEDSVAPFANHPDRTNGFMGR